MRQHEKDRRAGTRKRFRKLLGPSTSLGLSPEAAWKIPAAAGTSRSRTSTDPLSPHERESAVSGGAMADDFFGVPIRRLFWGHPAVLGEWRGRSAAGELDWFETPSAHVLKFNVPGYGRDDVKVQLEEDNVLCVEAAPQSKEEPAAKEAVWRVAERGKGGLNRRVALPENVKSDQVKAHVENGILTVVAPKETAPPKPKPRAIAVSSKL